MVISSDLNFLFIHIQKTGGTSISAALHQAAPDAVASFNHLFPGWNAYKKTHVFASTLQPHLDEQWHSLFKFAFVRNPWDRLVSWYSMCISRPNSPFMYYVCRNAPTFQHFVDLTSGIAARTTFNQVDYISDRQGNVIVDFVGRYETLASDFAALSKKLGINVALPWLNRGRRTPYRQYYTSATRDIVAERFQRDIRLFGYTFE